MLRTLHDAEMGPAGAGGGAHHITHEQAAGNEIDPLETFQRRQGPVLLHDDLGFGLSVGLFYSRRGAQHLHRPARRAGGHDPAEPPASGQQAGISQGGDQVGGVEDGEGGGGLRRSLEQQQRDLALGAGAEQLDLKFVRHPGQFAGIKLVGAGVSEQVGIVGQGLELPRPEPAGFQIERRELGDERAQDRRRHAGAGDVHRDSQAGYSGQGSILMDASVF